ncbi:glycosyltransferase [Gallaecimonas pentaromativorans]|uniref:Glycosyl transferase family 4 n=1 Tax=Gallaecimonas pentaromativorans TaxID=584787 RepID=A0A3N1PBI1_9GAMM|nr:glycosyltransferase [Gallaecimonas pentaromativorans]ROQ21996.1 glycosyl transferase family 4 [Gallaecimonas pentaromativorans]
MKLLVISSYKDTWNSVRPEAEMLIGLKEHGIELEVMTQDDAEYVRRFEEMGVKVHPYHPKKKFSLASIKYIRRVLKEGRFDAVYGFNNKAICNTNFAAIGLPVKVLTYRGQTGNIEKWNPTGYLTHLNPRVDRIVCVAKATEVDLRPQVWGNKNKVCTVYKGHDLAWYNDTPVDLSEFGIPEGAFVMGSVANLRPRKGLPVLMEMTHQLPKDANIHLLLVGGGMDKPEVQAMIDASPMKGRIHLAGFRKDAPAIIAGCDVSILASTKREGLPKTVIEAMVYGVAPIVSDTGGSAELIEDGISGIKIAPGDVKAMAEGVMRLFNDRELCRAMGENARQRIGEHFNVAQSARDLAKVIKDTVNGAF